MSKDLIEDIETQYKVVKELIESSLDFVKGTIKYINTVELQNTQEYLDFLDELNKLSVSN